MHLSHDDYISFPVGQITSFMARKKEKKKRRRNKVLPEKDFSMDLTCNQTGNTKRKHQHLQQSHHQLPRKSQILDMPG